MKPSLYLAGPITGLSYEQATRWREIVSHTLGDDFDCYSPMRNKGYLLNEVCIADRYTRYVMSTEQAIMFRDMFDVQRTDGLFINFLGATQVSKGTVMEIAVAWYLRKPIIIVMEKDNIHQHAMVRQSTPFIVETLDEGIDVAIRLFLK